MIITRQAILTANVRHPTAELTAQKMTMALVKFGITDPRSAAALLANLSVESGIVPKRENLYYRTAQRLREVFRSYFDPAYGGRYPTAPYLGNPVALANLVYANRLGNGDVASGDGWRNRGGGMIQTTGEANYQRTGELIGYPLGQHPELIEQIGISCLAACAYWKRMSRADAMALAGNIRATRAAVNGPRALEADQMFALYLRLLPLVKGAA